MPTTPTIAPDNQRRLLALRGVSLATTLAMALLAQPLFHILPSVPALLGVSGLWGIFAAFAWFRQRREVGEFELFAHLCVDIAILTAWLAFSGGSANPLTVLYLLSVSTAAALLRPQLAWATAIAAIAAYSLLWLIAVPITVEDVDKAMQMHLTGMWLTFALSAAMLVSIVARMSLTLRERDRRLAAARERMLRDERVVALGSLAAGAAHSLGTPLNTLTLLADEIAAAAPTNSVIAEDLRELRRQVERCRAIIDGLLREAGAVRADTAQSRLDAWLVQLVNNFRQLHPESAPLLEIDPSIANRRVNVDPALTQAISHLLDNAVDSGAQRIAIEAQSTTTHVSLIVRDNGAGFSSDALRNAGRQPYSGKRHGMGLGLYLAGATAERLGGHLECRNIEGGAKVVLLFPIAMLLATLP